jgi:RNA polymerase sigma-70 factor (ECF subfamily)
MDDTSAIEKCKKGEREAFSHLVERYQAQAVGHSVAILGNREDALDAVQEAFVDAFLAIKRFDTTRRFYPWFYVLLRHRCFKMAAQRKPSESMEEIEILAPQPNVSREESLALESALRALPDEDRELITLKYLDGLSYEELSERLEIPKGTVMSRLFYARKQMQAKLTGKFH